MAGNLLCSKDTLCHHIVLLFGERLDTLFTSSDSKICGFTRPHVIGFVADLFFSTLESGFNFFRVCCRIRRLRVDGNRIRKEKGCGFGGTMCQANRANFPPLSRSTAHALKAF